MAQVAIQEGFEVFASETGKPFGAVRQVAPHGRPELVICVRIPANTRCRWLRLPPSTRRRFS